MICRLYKRREKLWMKRKMHEWLTLDDEHILNPIITRPNFHKFLFIIYLKIPCLVLVFS
jgi:hypothetical protein